MARIALQIAGGIIGAIIAGPGALALGFTIGGETEGLPDYSNVDKFTKHTEEICGKEQTKF